MKKQFSRIIAGTMTWGTWGKNLSTDEMSQLIHRCLDSGINTFDHADIYGGYTTENAFGKAYKKSGVKREDVTLISKCGIQYPSEKRPLAVKYYDYSKKYILWSAENSLKSLQTDYLDLLLLHRPSPLMRSEEIAEAIGILKKDGKILDFGVSNFSPLQTDLIRQMTEVSTNQIQFSATHPEAMTDGSLDYMQLHDIQPMAWNPLGIVFREETPQTERIKIILARLQEKYDVLSDVILLAWILKHPAGILPVCGTTNPQRIRQLMQATIIDLEMEDWFAIWVESRGTKVP